MIVEYLDPTYVKSRLDYINLSISSLRDSIVGSGNKSLTDVVNALTGFLTESTFINRWDSGIYGWDGTTARKIRTDSNGFIQVSNLDVQLSTRASESTLSSLNSKIPSPQTLSDSIANMSTTILGSANLLFDGSNWRRMECRVIDVSGASRASIPVIASIAGDITRMPYMIENINVGTTESSTSITAPGAKIIKIKNRGDNDVLIGINGSVPANNPLKVRARTVAVFVFNGATSIYYKTASGSTTIDIEYWN